MKVYARHVNQRACGHVHEHAHALMCNGAHAYMGVNVQPFSAIPHTSHTLEIEKSNHF